MGYPNAAGAAHSYGLEALATHQSPEASLPGRISCLGLQGRDTSPILPCRAATDHAGARAMSLA
jgi:hypothetical protein